MSDKPLSLNPRAASFTPGGAPMSQSPVSAGAPGSPAFPMDGPGVGGMPHGGMMGAPSFGGGGPRQQFSPGPAAGGWPAGGMSGGMPRGPMAGGGFVPHGGGMMGGPQPFPTHAHNPGGHPNHMRGDFADRGGYPPVRPSVGPPFAPGMPGMGMGAPGMPPGIPGGHHGGGVGHHMGGGVAGPMAHLGSVNAGAGLHHPQHIAAVVAPPVALPKPAIFVCGAPRSGKTTVARRLADKKNMLLISYDRDAKLGDNLLKLKTDIRSNYPTKDGFILDSFACESCAEIFYLYAALKECGVGVAFVIYFFQEVGAMKRTPPFSAEEMHRHAVAYEICQKNFLNKESQFILARCMTETGKIRVKSAEELEAELLNDMASKFDTYCNPKIPKTRPLPQGVSIPIPLEKFPLSVEKSSELVEDYFEFQQILRDLGKALDLDLESYFPPRNVRSPLDYAKFTRFYSAFSGYKVSCVTESKRVVWFKHKNNLYYLPESSQHLMRFIAGSVAESMAAKTVLAPAWTPEAPVGWAVEAEIIPDDVEDSTAGQNATATEIPVVRDFLLLGNRRCTGLSREERAQLNPQPAGGVQEGGSNILVTKSFSVSDFDHARKFAMRIMKSTPVTGFRFDHPGPYVMGKDDPRCFIWYENAPPIIVRLWDSKETETGWQFSMYCLQDANAVTAAQSADDAAPTSPTSSSAVETLLTGCTLLVEFQTAEEHSLNDGQLVEVIYDDSKRSATASPAAAGGKGSSPKPMAAGTFSFCRRRQDLYWPMYMSAVNERLKWKKWEQCKRMCAAVKEPADTWFEVDGLRSPGQAIAAAATGK